ncbi:MAG: rRNA maturation RNase YbeY [Lachnospiraceae bacterium]|nr:rRNA maturation RNase YbeY [Lachnospiraceae bacterium]
MTIIFENESGCSLPFDALELAKKTAEAVLDQEQCPYEAEINLLLTDNKGIQKVNKETRNIEHPTDVLSFPALEYEKPGDFTFLEDEELFFHPETGELMLGDILISVDKVHSQAEEYGHTLQREFAFLVVHSMLHLCGYDHMEEAEASVMEQKQKSVLDSLGIIRD